MRTFQGRSPRVRRFRFLAPAGVFAVIAGAAWIPTLRASASPSGLPSMTAAQLLVAAQQAKMPPLSGTLRWDANLGLSSLSALQSELGAQTGSAGNGFNPANLLSGNHTIDIWLGAKAEHLALSDAAGSETDLVRNGRSLWLWDSTSQVATHLVASADRGVGTRAHRMPAETKDTAPELTPEQTANQLLAHVGPTTSVSVGQPVYVGGQATYQLDLAPAHQGSSTVAKVEIDLGASGALKGVPLQVAVYAVGVAKPAIEFGFTGKISVGEPPASELTFSPPPGATVKTKTLASGQSPWSEMRSSAKARGPMEPSGQASATSTPSSSRSHTIGQGWSAVVVLPGAAAGTSLSTLPAELAALTSPVTVKGQGARLFQTDLLNVLLMPNGTVYAGMVTPAALEADAASAAS